MSDQQSEHSWFLTHGRYSGRRAKLTRRSPPIYGIQQWCNDLKPDGYGADPEGKSCVISLLYRPWDKQGKILAPETPIAGYISPENEILADFTSYEKFRIGVSLSRVKSSLKARIDLADRLLKWNTYPGPARILNIRWKILLQRLTELKIMIAAGVSHLVLATIWNYQDPKNDEMHDFLDLNKDFFDTFYPESGFPIGDPETMDTNSWVNRDTIIWKMLREGRLDKTTHMGDRTEWVLNNPKPFGNNLHITFNSQPTAIWKDEPDREEILWDRLKKVEDIIHEVKLDLNDHKSGWWAQRAKRNATSVVIALLHREGLIDDVDESRMDELYQAIIQNAENEVNSYINELNNIVDPCSKDVDRVFIMAYDCLRILQGISPGKETNNEESNAEPEVPYETRIDLLQDSLRSAFKDKCEKRVEKLIERARDRSRVESVVYELVWSLESAQKWGSTRCNRAGDGDLYIEVCDLLSSKILETMREIADAPNWDAVRFLRLNNANELLGAEFQLGPSEAKRIQEINKKAMVDRYQGNQSLDRKMRSMIENHVYVFENKKLPEPLGSDSVMLNFAERVKAGYEPQKSTEISISQTEDLDYAAHRISSM